MTITTRWYDEEKHAVHCLFEGKWNWTELFEAFETSDRMVETVDYPVKIIADMYRTQHIPVLSPSAMAKIASMSTNRPDNVSGVIFVGARGFVKAMFDIFSRIYPKAAEKYQFAANEAELASLIAQNVS